MESRPRKIQIYEGADGERPFETWFNSRCARRLPSLLVWTVPNAAR
jgi:hypothetical protein